MTDELELVASPRGLRVAALRGAVVALLVLIWLTLPWSVVTVVALVPYLVGAALIVFWRRPGVRRPVLVGVGAAASLGVLKALGDDPTACAPALATGVLAAALALVERAGLLRATRLRARAGGARMRRRRGGGFRLCEPAGRLHE